jgi:hypothetical protein
MTRVVAINNPSGISVRVSLGWCHRDNPEISHHRGVPKRAVVRVTLTIGLASPKCAPIPR